MTDQPERNITPVSTENEFVLMTGRNLDNHSASLQGQAKYIRTGVAGPLVFRTRQSVYRMCAYLMTLVETHDLPDEPGDHTYQEVEEAIQNS